MITEWDDLLIHQVITTMDHVESSDPRWHNRHWFHLGDVQGEVLLGVGMGVYPNRNVMDGFAVAIVEGAQYNVLVSRELGRDRYTAVGPLRIDVERGLRTLRVALEPNDHEVCFDLTFQAGMPPFEEATHFQRHKGRVARNNARYNQAGRFSGRLSVAGQSWEITPERFWGVRDRSWGLRPGQGEPLGGFTHKQRHDLLRRIGFGFYHYNPTQFPDYSLFYMVNEDPAGVVNAVDGGLRFPYGSERENEVVRVTAVESNMEFIADDANPALLSRPGRRLRRQGSLARLVPRQAGRGGKRVRPDGRAAPRGLRLRQRLLRRVALRRWRGGLRPVRVRARGLGTAGLSPAVAADLREEAPTCCRICE